MEIRSEVRQAVMSFCDAWFRERNLEKILPFLAENINFVGTGLKEIANGKEEMTEWQRLYCLKIRILRYRERFSCQSGFFNL